VKLTRILTLIARAAIEDEYARKLLALCRKSLGSSETGTLRVSLDVVRGETEAIAKAHAAISQQMKSELEEPLAAFAGGMKERRKIVQNSIERLLKIKNQQTHTVNKVGTNGYHLDRSCRANTKGQNRHEIDTSKTVCESKAT
jgi:hypothetical protein